MEVKAFSTAELATIAKANAEWVLSWAAIAIIAYGTYVNIPKYFSPTRFFAFLPILLALAFQAEPKLLRAIALYSFVISALTIAPYSFRTRIGPFVSDWSTPMGQDYWRYSWQVSSWMPKDLPLSWILMKTATALFGNPLGLKVVSLSAILASAIIIMLMNDKKGDLFLYALIPIIFLQNQSIKYMAGGVLRTLLAFAIITYIVGLKPSNIKPPEERSIFVVLILGLTHIPSTIYYILYKILRKEHIKATLISAIAVLSGMLALGAIFGGLTEASAFKPIQLLMHRISIPQGIITNIRNFDYHSWNPYAFSYLSILPFGLGKYITEPNKETFVWLVLATLPFIPIFFWKIMLRILHISWLPMIMLLQGAGATQEGRLYASLLAFHAIGSSVP